MSVEKGAVKKVLDHGYVKLIDWMGSDETIIEAARMSTGRGFEGWEKDSNLLDFLWRHRHSTPFEMCELSIEVQAPIFVFREWHRHRTQSYNEFSARYSKMPDLHYVPERERLQKQSTTNKQGSAEAVAPEYAETVIKELKGEQSQIYAHYEQLLSEGVAKEVARINTPVARYSKMRAKTDLWNWLSFCNLRMRPNAQAEIREYALAVAEIVQSLWPKTWALFEEYSLYSVSLSRTEMRILRRVLDINFDLEKAAKEEGLDGSKLKEFVLKVQDGGTALL